MNTDPSVNVVVFEVLVGRRLQKLLGEGPTRAADGIRRVWEQLVTGVGVRPADVRRVYAQWEPTPDDRAFLATEFPRRVRVSYSFSRPGRRAWGGATTEFIRAVEEFELARDESERVVSAVTSAAVETRGRRPWWQYWDRPGGANNPLAGTPA
jgi:hypothetical protein